MKLGLHFGLNAVNPDSYLGWDGELLACVNDARCLAALFAQHGFETSARFNEDATLGAIREALHTLAAGAVAGDTIVLSFSGHGGRRGAWNFSGYTETLCFYDGQFADAELRAALEAFAPGVRVAVILDSCHSGGMDRAVPGSGLRVPSLHGRVRAMPRYLDQRLPVPAAPAARGKINAAVLLATACRADEVALDGIANGAFTGALLQSRDLNPAMPTWAEWFGGAVSQLSLDGAAQHPVAHRLGADTLWLQPLNA